jgi:hypothetical protein
MLTAPLSRKIFPPANLSNKVWQIGLTDLGSYSGREIAPQPVEKAGSGPGNWTASEPWS